MMPQDPAPSPGSGHFPSATTIALLRDALPEMIQHSDREHEVQRGLTLLAAEARAHGLHAEEMVIVLKNFWTTLPEAQHALDRGERQRLLGRLVTFCIDEYYHE